MKTRVGFVSNSSSSSFIASVLPGTKKFKIMIEVDPNEVGLKRIRNEQELNAYLLGHCYKTIEEAIRGHAFTLKEYNAYLAELHKGYHLLMGTVTNEGEPGAEYVLAEIPFESADPDVHILSEQGF